MGIVASAACCGGGICCNILCGVCMRCCNTTQQQHTRIGYIVFLLISIGFAMLFLFEGGNMMDTLNDYGYGNIHSDCHGSDKNVCLGVETVYRLSFAMAVFHLLMIPAALTSGEVSSMLNGELYIDGCWIMKLVLVSCIFVGCFFIPDDFFDGYAEFSRYTSILFLIVQVVLIIDFSYAWNEKWLENYEASGGSNFWMFWLFFFSAVMWILSLTVTVFNYYWFTNESGCGLNIFLITQSLVFGIGFTVLSITSWVEHGCKIYVALLTSSAVNLYCVYLTWAGLSSTDDECNTLQDSESTALNITFGLIPLVIILLYVAFRKKERGEENNTPIRDIADPMIAKEEDDQDEGVRDTERASSYVYFYLLLVLASIYIAMLVTNWGAPKVDGESLDTNEGSIWVRFSAQWVTTGIYVWSLIAPRVCSGRDFG